MISIKCCMCLYLVLCYTTFVVTHLVDDIDDASKTVIELIEKYGYPVEEHIITTPDGYILSVYRLPNPKAKDSILLVHGLMGSSSDYILLGPGKALAFMLYESGYDVWMINCRGSSYSQNHTTFESSGPTSNQFWNYSHHEMGIYDLPSTVDYILDATDRSQIVHYGHSQGTTVLFVMLAEKPEYNAKIKAAFLISPTAFLCHATNRIIRLLMPFVQSGQGANLRKQFGDFDVTNILPSFFLEFLKINCGRTEVMTGMCLSFLYELVNSSPSRVDTRILTLVFGFYPHGGSTKLLLHFGQAILMCKFKKFQEDPNIMSEDYNLQNINVPIYAFLAQNDTIQDGRDTMNLKNTLPNGFKETHVVENFGHSDFALAREVPRLVFDKVLDILDSI